MSRIVVVTLGVGPPAAMEAVSLAKSVEAVAAAEAAGVTFIRLQVDGGVILAPEVVGSFLADQFPSACFLVEPAEELDAPTGDLVAVSEAASVGADARLRTALDRVGRRREEVALLGRVEVSAGDATRKTAHRLNEWADRENLDGFELVPARGLAGWNAVVWQLVPLLDPTGSRCVLTP
ncbi:hypothetical protein AB0P21_25255 [Kribbella sp. NPDC056861]|uniref:hypothetical protein n=1 Tax=Kribbella sp. NPDC056861 TaxID=3154857 RepID=UPI0034268F5E